MPHKRSSKQRLAANEKFLFPVSIRAAIIIVHLNAREFLTRFITGLPTRPLLPPTDWQHYFYAKQQNFSAGKINNAHFSSESA